MPTRLQPLPWHSFHLPKRGHSEEEYEDAFAANPERNRFAVADGASESSFAGPWARLLAEGFVSGAGHPWKEVAWLGPLRERWAKEVGRAALPWYAEMKREQGAFATVLGLALRRPNHWRPVAVGDSCLLQLRGGQLLTSFPLQKSADFGNNPALLSSRGGTGGQPSVLTVKGRWETGDIFLLMTDALAQWYLAQLELKRQPWDRLKSLPATANPSAAFAKLVAELLDRQEMRNDDVTLLWAEATPELPKQ